MRLLPLHVLHPHNGIEDYAGRKLGQCEQGLPALSAGKESQAKTLGQSLQEVILRQPPLAGDQAVAVLPEIDALEHFDHFLPRRRAAPLAHQLQREVPVIVRAAAILRRLDFFVRDHRSGEVFHGLNNCLAIRLRNIHEDAVHVKDEQALRSHHSRAQARRKTSSSFLVCAIVPTVMRTQPGSS